MLTYALDVLTRSEFRAGHWGDSNNMKNPPKIQNNFVAGTKCRRSHLGFAVLQSSSMVNSGAIFL